MVSKSRKQRQVRKNKRESGNTEPTQISTGKSVHLKKVRPNMKGKMKIRMGHESADIYEGFENSKQINWKCPACGNMCRVVGFCVACEAAKHSQTAGSAAAAASSSSAQATAKQPIKRGGGANTKSLAKSAQHNVRSGKAAKMETVSRN